MGSIPKGADCRTPPTKNAECSLGAIAVAAGAADVAAPADAAGAAVA